VGRYFNLQDCRIWLRLHFWSAREEGLFEPQHAGFMAYYQKFLAHFVSVYERTAPPFVRESARWSESAANTQAYLENGRRMPDHDRLSGPEAAASLPPDERAYFASKEGAGVWPYC
jgi:hypothetical protein